MPYHSRGNTVAGGSDIAYRYVVRGTWYVVRGTWFGCCPWDVECDVIYWLHSHVINIEGKHLGNIGEPTFKQDCSHWMKWLTRLCKISIIKLKCDIDGITTSLLFIHQACQVFLVSRTHQDKFQMLALNLKCWQHLGLTLILTVSCI